MMLEQKIKDTLAKVEEAGEEGRVDEAQVLTDQVEKMQQDLQHLKQVKRDRSLTDLELCFHGNKAKKKKI